MKESMAALVVTAAGRRYAVSESDLASVGRDPACTIPLEDERVSRRHAVLRHDRGTWIYEDMASRNGSFANGARITRVLLTNGTAIRIGNPSDGPLLQFATGVDGTRVGRLLGRVLAGAAFVTLLALAALGASAALTPSPSAPPTANATATAAASLTLADAAALGRAGTVHIYQGNVEGTGTYLGGGRVLTAAHVVATTAPAIVYFADQRVGTGQVVRIDRGIDLALLTVTGLEALGARPLEWADSNLLRPGDELLALGYPEGLPFSVKAGIMSGLRTARGVNFIQTDASLNHGMSGGPVLDRTGRLVGITD